jgi:hypothetical protein
MNFGLFLRLEGVCRVLVVNFAIVAHGHIVSHAVVTRTLVLLIIYQKVHHGLHYSRTTTCSRL